MAEHLQEIEARVAALRGPSREAVEALSSLKGEPAWMREQRLQAWEVYAAAGLPQWPYINAGDFKLDHLAPFAAPSPWDSVLATLPGDLQAVVRGEREAAGLVVQADSAVVHAQLAEDLADKGVILTDLDTALREHGDLVREHFLTGGGIAMAEDRFVALHAALWSGGLFLYVPKHTEVELPFYFYQTLTRPGVMVQPHNLVILEPGALVNLYEEYHSEAGNDRPFSGASTFMHLKDGSHLRVVLVQRWGTHVSEVSKHQAMVGRDARFSITSAFVGGGLVQTQVRAELRGQGANSDMQTMVLAAGSQHLDIINENRHHNANTHGDMLAKQVLRDTARTAFQGLIYIDRNSPQSTDYLTENALVLDPGARADAIPGLEILNDDVQASHGATVGQIDESQIFYLMSRGVSRANAELMIVNGFFDPLLRRVREEDTRERLAQMIAEKVRRRD